MSPGYIIISSVKKKNIVFSSTYKGCPKISEALLRMNLERYLSAFAGTIHFSYSITDKKYP